MKPSIPDPTTFPTPMRRGVVGWVLIFFLAASLAAADPVSQAVHLIATWEGFSATPYRDQGGCWTVGYGHLLTCNQDVDPEQWGTVTEEDAEAWLRARVQGILDHVVFDLRGRKLSDEKLVALASLAYNIGHQAFHDSELLQMILDREPVGEIAREWGSWDHVNGEVSRGLSRRRLAEIGLFFFGTSHFR